MTLSMFFVNSVILHFTWQLKDKIINIVLFRVVKYFKILSRSTINRAMFSRPISLQTLLQIQAGLIVFHGPFSTCSTWPQVRTLRLWQSWFYSTWKMITAVHVSCNLQWTNQHTSRCGKHCHEFIIKAQKELLCEQTARYNYSFVMSFLI